MAVLLKLGLGGVSRKTVWRRLQVGGAAEGVDGRRRVDVAGAVDGPHLEGEQAVLDERDLPGVLAADEGERGVGRRGRVGRLGRLGGIGLDQAALEQQQLGRP